MAYEQRTSDSYTCATCGLALASPNAPCPNCLRDTGNPWPHLKNPLVDLVDKPGLGAAMRHAIEQATVARISKERLGVIKQTPRQASIDDIEWLCEEVERLRNRLDKFRGLPEHWIALDGDDGEPLDPNYMRRSAPETLQPASNQWDYEAELRSMCKCEFVQPPCFYCACAHEMGFRRQEIQRLRKEREAKPNTPETGEGNCLSCYQSRRASFDREAALSARASELQYIVEVLLSIQKHGNEYARESATDLLAWLRNRQSADTSYEARAAQETPACVYESEPGDTLTWETGCGNVFRLDSELELYEFCPYCGKAVSVCSTCNGTREIDETLGGIHTSNPHARCPDCAPDRAALKDEAERTNQGDSGCIMTGDTLNG